MAEDSYRTVATWRDEVSHTLGSISTSITDMEKNLEKLCSQGHDRETRIKKLETHVAETKAVNKFAERMKGAILTIIGIIAGVVGTLLAK